MTVVRNLKDLGLIALFLGAAVQLNSCAKDFEGEYADPTKVEIVDDKWNETDSRKTAEKLIKSCLNRPWLSSHMAKNNKQRPVVIVGDVENRTDEHIDTKALTDHVQDELINSGKVRFVNAERRQKILDEINYQASGAVSKTTQKQFGRQTGADFLLAGGISSSVHTQGGLKTVTYQIKLNLTNLETAEIEWSQRYSIKKRFNRSGADW